MPTTFTAPISPVTSFSSLDVGSLNCRGLAKTADISIRNSLFDTFALVLLICWHFKKLTLQPLSMIYFIPNFKPKLVSGLVIVVCPCERIISTTVSHASNAFDPVAVTVVYFPASRA
ncbi:hypothetical protein INT47_003841 [Mucor saturninus]|uniref:Uncharacterized protein n=1 Tax=Mucor saturninus TaxID=64648 RepID=A0A8H7UQ68_9FUNG|nr:hypothetical protein INT47_003841 [Mucor saturninus]